MTFQFFSLVYFASVSMDVSRSKYLSVKCTLTVTHCVFLVSRTSGDRPAEWRWPRWGACNRLVADMAAAESALHQTLALRSEEPSGNLCPG